MVSKSQKIRIQSPIKEKFEQYGFEFGLEKLAKIEFQRKFLNIF